ncbi:MAG: hypothetical protein NVS3B20_27370 [Polyangiales bacterium]
MMFVLRSERAPSRVVRETDDAGVERTFWLWPHGAWVVAVRYDDGRFDCLHAREISVELHQAGSVVIVAVKARPMAATIPAPASDSIPAVTISSVVPVASRSPSLGCGDSFGLDDDFGVGDDDPLPETARATPIPLLRTGSK